jgi:hypothetical protein
MCELGNALAKERRTDVVSVFDCNWHLGSLRHGRMKLSDSG